MLAALLAIVLTNSAHAACDYDSVQDQPRVAFNQSGVTGTVVFADDMCDGLVGTEGCGTSAETAFGGVTPHCSTTVSASFTAVGEAPALADAESDTLIRQKSFFQTAAFQPSTTRGDRKLTVTIGGDDTMTFSVVLDDDAWANGTWDETTSDTHTVAGRLVRNDDGTAYLEVKLQGLKRTAALGAYTTASVSADAAIDGNDDTEMELGLARTRGKIKLKSRTAGDSPDGYTYDYAFGFPDIERDDLEGRVAIRSEGAVGIVRSRLKQKKNGDLKHVAWTIDDVPGGANAFDVGVYDTEGQGVLILDGDAPTFTASVYSPDAEQSFDDSPVGSEYSLTLAATLDDGSVSSETHDVTATIDGTSGTIDLSGWGLIDSGGIEYTLDGTDMSLVLATTGGKTTAITSIEVQFNEPFEGATPQENPLTFAFAYEVHKWVQTAGLTDAQATDDLEVDAVFYNSDDDIVEAMSWTGRLGEDQTGASIDSTALNVVKAVKSLTGLGLKEAK